MMLAIARGFAERGHGVELLVFRRSGELRPSTLAGVRLIRLDTRRPILAVPALARYLHRTRPDVVFASEHYSGLPLLYAAALARFHGPCFIRQDNTLSMDLSPARRRQRWLAPWGIRWFFPRAYVIAVSRGVQADFLRLVDMPAGHVRTIYNPVLDTTVAECGKVVPGHPWFTTHNKPVVLAVGRLTPPKGFDVLIRAFARLQRKVGARLLILGEGSERGTLQALATQLGVANDVQLAGFQDNPWSFMARCDAFVLSSRFEGLPTVLIEALSLGANVVAADCPSGPREILDDGRFGRLVPPESADALADALYESLSEPQVADPSLPAWLEQFQPEGSIAKHLQFVDDVLAHRV